MKRTRHSARACTVLRYLNPQPTDRILDDGCGLGFYLHLLARLTHCAVWGVDRDEDRLAAAAADAYASQTRRVRADVTTLPFREATFDKVISSEVLEHLDDDTAAMQEVAQVSNARGMRDHRAACRLPRPVGSHQLPARGRRPGALQQGPAVGHLDGPPPTLLVATDRRSRGRRGLVDHRRASRTRHVFPFSHHLIYVVGKAVIESGVLGQALRQRSDLWTDDPRWTPSRALAKMVAWPDRFNRGSYPRGPAVSLCVRAVK